MRASQYLLSTQKETPADAEIISHQLMIRAGMIRKLASGLYNWLPTGLRVLRKVEAIVREEMNKAGSLEVLMPMVQPAELWQESTRWDEYGVLLLRVKDRHDRDFCLGPTHEEVITDIVRNEINSYKQLPANFYQIQTKFRDETRPRFGVMRAREFIMKDAYSFHINAESLQSTYDDMHKAYCNIFDRVGLNYRPVIADNGDIGGNGSHEFHVLADSGEDAIVFSDASDYAANIEMAEAVALPAPDCTFTQLDEIATPGAVTIDGVAKVLNVQAAECVKTLIVEGEESLIALVIRGDHTLNDVKASKLDGVNAPLTMASDDAIFKAIGCKPGSIGPINLNLPIYVDRSAAELSHIICGANKDGVHLVGAPWPSDLSIVDIRNVHPGDPSPCGQGQLHIKRGVEVGHIFQLGTKYSNALGANVLDEHGKSIPMSMGCYGIGVTRIVAAVIEQNHDDKGIIWPSAIAPFQVAIIPINLHKSETVKTECERLYQSLIGLGIEVLYRDDHKARLGMLLADTELMGIPHRVIIGDRGLESNQMEYQHRRAENSEHIDLDISVEFIQQRVSSMA